MLDAPSIYISKVQSSDSYLQTSCASETDTPLAKTAYKFELLVKKKFLSLIVYHCVPFKL
jgi:hypothetical protein